jgi:taurine dioxygenase
MNAAFDSDHIKFEPIRDDFGAIVHGVELSEPLSSQQFDQIRDGHVRHGLLIFRDQTLTPEQEISFARRFNKIRLYLGNDDTKLPGHPEINVLGNVVEDGRQIGHQVKIGIEWHTDGTGFQFPAVATVLYCLESPNHGGETLFASGKRAWEELSLKRQIELETVRVLYSFHHLYNKLHKAAGTGKSLTDNERSKSPEVAHPLVRTHSVTGKKALWFTRSEMKQFVGLSESQSAKLATEIVALISKPEYVYSHVWRPGDLLVWDNRWMHHSTTPYTYADERRLMHRVSGEGDEIPH